ncbi:MAG: cation:dicarboxylase symporter family transporter, partial [Chromatiales bacterium]
MPEPKMHHLTRRIMLAMGLGALLGIVLNLLFGSDGLLRDYLIDGLLYVVGAIFVASLKMLVVPLVFVSLVNGVTSLGNLSALGRMSVKAILLYLFTTAVAISIALALATAVGPGQGFDAGSAQVSFDGKAAPPLSDVFIDMVPTNPVAALSEGNMLQIIVFSLLFGIAITLAGERGK